MQCKQALTVCKTVFSCFLTLSLFQCEWAKRRAEQKKKVAYFHKRLVWKNGRAQGCDSNFHISKFRRDENDRLRLLAFNEQCTIYFELLEKEWRGKFSKIFFQRAIITTNDIEKKVEFNSKLEVEDIGWGFKFSWKVLKSDMNYLFLLYMKPGVDGNPLRPRDL